MRSRLRLLLIIGILAGISILAAIWWIIPKYFGGGEGQSAETTATGKDNRPAVLLYLYPTTGASSLFMIRAASGEIQKLTEAGEGVLDYTVQNDGKAVYYSLRNGQSGSIIYKLELGGMKLISETPIGTPEEAASEPDVVMECQRAMCQGLGLDPQNGHLAYERSDLPGSGGTEFPRVWILPLKSGQNESSYLAGNPSHQTEQPSWSSKGLIGFYDHTDGAYIFAESGGKEVGRFANQVGQGGVWHPNGDAFLAPEITYSVSTVTSPELSELVPLADSHLILFHLKTNKQEDLTPGRGVEDASPAFSHRGDFLAFGRKYLDTKRWTPGRQIWIARTDNREARALTEMPDFNHFDFAWSPSGDQLAFSRFDQSALNEPPEIWVYDLLSGVSRQLVVGGYLPLWLP